MKKLRYLLAVTLVFFTVSAFAQGGFDGFEDGDPGGPSEEVPIDGGALALLAGGAVLGYKALKKKRAQ